MTGSVRREKKELCNEREFNLFSNQVGSATLCSSQGFCSCISIFHLTFSREKYRLILVHTDLLLLYFTRG